MGVLYRAPPEIYLNTYICTFIGVQTFIFRIAYVNSKKIFSCVNTFFNHKKLKETPKLYRR